MNPPAAPAPPKDDFADWLSPILVKELRQGLRTRVFTSTFILLQVVLTACVVVGLLVAANGGNTAASTGIFWALVSLPLALVLPWSGLGAVSGEVKANTLDLLFLTRLSAWRILVGKWIAILAQSLLLLAAVLPYVVLRYFMGGVELAAELLGLALLFGVSAVLSAILVGLSAYPGRLMRLLVVVAMAVGAQMVLPIILYTMLSPFTGAFGLFRFSWPLLGALGVVLALVAAMALEFGAARIAPAAENHSARKRALGFAILASAAIAAGVVGPGAAGLTIAGLLAVSPILIGALSEENSSIPSVYRPFARRGFPGRLLGRILYPGWASGAGYAVLLLGGFGALLALQECFADWRAALAYASFCGALLFPAALLRLFVRPPRRFLPLYLGFQFSSLALTACVRIVDQVTGTDAGEFLAVLPTCALMIVGTNGVPPEHARFVAILVGAASAAGLLVLLALAFAAFRKISALERASLAGSASDDRVA